MARSISDEQIIDAALEMMARHGYAGATTKGIAKAAGINEVTLFRRFGSKKNILMAIVQQEAASFADAGIGYSGDLQGDLEKIVLFYHELIQSRGHVIGMLFTELPRQPELMEVMQTPLSILGKNGELIAAYQTKGELTDEPAAQILVRLLGPLFMTALSKRVDPAIFDFPFDAEQHVKRFLEGHRPSRIG